MNTPDKVNEALKNAYNSDPKFKKICDEWRRAQTEVLKGTLSEKELEDFAGAGWRSFR